MDFVRPIWKKWVIRLGLKIHELINKLLFIFERFNDNITKKDKTN